MRASTIPYPNGSPQSPKVTKDIFKTSRVGIAVFNTNKAGIRPLKTINCPPFLLCHILWAMHRLSHVPPSEPQSNKKYQREQDLTKPSFSLFIFFLSYLFHSPLNTAKYQPILTCPIQSLFWVGSSPRNKRFKVTKLSYLLFPHKERNE